MKGSFGKILKLKMIVPLIKVIAAIAILIILDACIYALWNGIADKIVSFVTSNDGTVVELKDKIAVQNLLIETQPYVINKDELELLKSSMISDSIDTEKSGITEVRLRKILLAYIASTSLSNTFCAVEVDEEDILSNLEEKGKVLGQDYSYDTVDQFTYDWITNHPDFVGNKYLLSTTTTSTVYYEPSKYTEKVFFYFHDLAGKLDENNEVKWYLGCMGATKIGTSNRAATSATGDTLVEELSESEEALVVSPEQFNELKVIFENSYHDLLYKTEGGEEVRDWGVKNKKVLELDSYKALKRAICKNGENTIQVYNVEVNLKEYDYRFYENNLEEKGKLDDLKFEEYDPGEDNLDVKVEVVTKDLTEDCRIDTNRFKIPVELMLDLMDVTGSGEFLDEFIDFALSNTNVTLKAYSISNETDEYDIRKYNIKNDFIIEIYDLKKGLIDVDGDNFRTYKDIIFDRKYEGAAIGRVTDIENYKDIDLSSSADPLETYLKTAYDPKDDFTLGTIEVIEGEITSSETTSWDFAASEMNTWYADFTYAGETIKVYYNVPGKVDEATAQEFEDFGYGNLIELDAYKTVANPSTEQKEVRYVYKKLLEQVPESELGSIPYSKQESNDIYDDPMATNPGIVGKTHFWNWTLRGLATIGMIDGGDKNNNLGAGEGSDYLYAKYIKNNIADYKASKSKNEYLDRSNVTQSTSNIDQKLKMFLGLLCNESGEIPTSASECIFKAKNDGGKVVKYGDVYKGAVPVGDMLLDNGAEMLFDLLKVSPQTQNLENVFRYLAYLYSGHDYGVTDISTLETIFNLTSLTGYAGSTFEEKVWFALIGAGYSKAGAAGIMGNLHAESGIKSNNLENSYESKLGFTDETYTAAINNGTYTRNQFISDAERPNLGAGYGLAQWSYDSRKAALYDLCKSKGVGIDDEDTQIEFLLSEIRGNSQLNVLKTTNDVYQATEIFMKIFERPGNISRSAVDGRASVAQAYYTKYKDSSLEFTLGPGNNSFVAVAAKCHKYFEDNHFSYLQGNEIPYPNGTRHTDCSAYVTWVLYEYGYRELRGHQRDVGGLNTFCAQKGFTKIINKEQIKAGDILFFGNSHVEIVRIDGDWKNTYNCGGNTSINDRNNTSGAAYTGMQPTHAYRVK